jgi:hypothetical protein
MWNPFISIITFPEQGACLRFSCPWRIEILTDSTGDRAAQVRRVTLAESSGWQSQDQISLSWRVYRLKQRPVSLEVQFSDVRRIPQGARVFGKSGSHRCVIEASAVRLPSIGMEIGDGL